MNVIYRVSKDVMANEIDLEVNKEWSTDSPKYLRNLLTLLSAFKTTNSRSDESSKNKSKEKGLKVLFCKSSYHVLMIDEFKISCRCSDCTGAYSTLRKRRNSKKYDKS